MPTNRPNFDIVRFSGSKLTKEISSELKRIPTTQVANVKQVIDITSATGRIIASPPLPPINANVNSIVKSTNDLAKNPVGVVRGALKTSFGRVSDELELGLLQLKGTLTSGIKTCLLNSVLSLTNKIPNIPFGGIDLKINKKLNDLLGMQLKLGLDLATRKINLELSINTKFDAFKKVKSISNLTGKLQGELNKEINKACNKISPRNKKGLSNNSFMTQYANQQINAIMKCVEGKITKAAGGFTITSPVDFFDKITGKILDPATQAKAEAEGKVAGAFNKVAGTISGAIDSVDSAIAKTTGTVQSILIPIGTTATKAIDSINRAINSNVAKLLPDPKKCD